MYLSEVIRKEFELIRKRRRRIGHPYWREDDAAPVTAENNSAVNGSRNTAGVPNPTSVEKKQPCTTLIGLTLSGGGIRSAATNLGVLQGLSEMGILSGVDYISTVSGGGYIGACMASLLSNKDRKLGGKGDDPYSFATEGDEEKKALFATGWHDDPFREDLLEGEFEKDDIPFGVLQMEHIRTRASYLAPGARHFSAPVMRALGSVFISTFMSLLWFTLVITVITSLYMMVVSHVSPDLDMEAITPEHIETMSKEKYKVASPTAMMKIRTYQEKLVENAVKPFRIFHSIGKTGDSQADTGTKAWMVGLGFFVLGILIVGLGSGIVCRHLKKHNALCFLCYLAFLLALLYPGSSLWQCFPSIKRQFGEGAILVAPPLFAGGSIFGAWLGYIAFSQKGKWDINRRAEFHQLMGILVISLLFAFVWAALPAFMNSGIGFYNTILLVVVGAGLRSAVAGENRTVGKKKTAFTPKFKEWLLGICALVFFFLAVVYAGNLIREILPNGSWPADHSVKELFLKIMLPSVLLLLLFHLVVDVNKISPHYFYRDRLAETFLQTENPDTKAKDEPWLRNDENMKLADLHGNDKEGCAARGPYLLMNATLNLTAAQDLKAFNRKSDIFTFSRLFVGSEKTGFMPTSEYEVEGEPLKLARAMAISGAAVTSVMGVSTSLARSFVCTVLGVRLGYWMPNCRQLLDKRKELKKKRAVAAKIDAELVKLRTEVKEEEQENTIQIYQNEKNEIQKQIEALVNETETLAHTFGKHGFRNNFLRMFKELLGHTVVKEREVYLSDGGHTGDNLGIIPLLKRRVRLLIVSDSECDPNHSFNSFNSSVRNAYVDEGIQIRICLDGLRKNDKGMTRDKFAIGRIIYPGQDKNVENWLVLFKNTLTGREISTIVNYKEKSDDFPHETTGDQFFTEEQFESYRALGRFAVVDSCESKRSWMDGCRASARTPTVSIGSGFDFLNKVMDKYKPGIRIEQKKSESQG